MQSYGNNFRDTRDDDIPVGVHIVDGLQQAIDAQNVIAQQHQSGLHQLHIQLQATAVYPAQLQQQTQQHIDLQHILAQQHLSLQQIPTQQQQIPGQQQPTVVAADAVQQQVVVQSPTASQQASNPSYKAEIVTDNSGNIDIYVDDEGEGVVGGTNR